MAVVIQQSGQDTANMCWKSALGVVVRIVATLPRHLARLSDIRLRRSQSQVDNHTTNNVELAERQDGIDDKSPAGDGAASQDATDAKVSRPKSGKRGKYDKRGKDTAQATVHKGPKSRDRKDMPKTMARKKAKDDAEANSKAQSQARAEAAAKAKMEDEAKRKAKREAKARGNGKGNGKAKRASPGNGNVDEFVQDLAQGPIMKVALMLLAGLKINFSTKHNAMYGLPDMYRMLLAICGGDSGKRSAYYQYSDSKKRKSREKLPSSWWLLTRIGSARHDFMLKRCTIMIRRTVLHAKRHGMLRNPVDISIDEHDIPFHAKCINMVYALGSRGKKGTHTFNRLATVHCVTDGQRLTLGMIVVQGNDKPVDVVRRLLDMCVKSGVRISSLTMDRGYYATNVMLLVQSRGINMSCRQ